MKVLGIAVLVCALVISQSQAEEATEAGLSRGTAKGGERVPVCECTCELKNEGGGNVVYKSTIWFNATADTKCEDNNGAKCQGKQGAVSFIGKTKDCIKYFKEKD